MNSKLFYLHRCGLPAASVNGDHLEIAGLVGQVGGKAGIGQSITQCNLPVSAVVTALDLLHSQVRICVLQELVEVGGGDLDGCFYINWGCLTNDGHKYPQGQSIFFGLPISTSHIPCPAIVLEAGARSGEKLVRLATWRDV